MPDFPIFSPDFPSRVVILQREYILISCILGTPAGRPGAACGARVPPHNQGFRPCNDFCCASGDSPYGDNEATLDVAFPSVEPGRGVDRVPRKRV